MTEHPSGRISFRAIETFIAVVETRSVSLAAKRLGSSISSVSMQLSNLEKALGCQLVERTAQRFSVTEAGQIFLHRAERIVDEMDGARAELSARKQASYFTLRLAVIEDFDNHILPRWIAALNTEFPNAQFIVKSGPSHESFAILSGREADMIVAVDAMEPVDWVEEHSLMKDPYLVVHSACIGPDPDMEKLKALPFFRYSRELHMGRQIEAQMRRVKFTPRWQHEFSSNQALFSAVAEFGGWTISTASAVHGTLSHRNSDQHGLRFSPLPFASFKRSLSLYARHNILGDVPHRAAARLRIGLSNVFKPDSNGMNLPVLPDIVED